MTKSNPERAPKNRIFAELCEFLPALDAFTQSYGTIKNDGRRPRFNCCHRCMAGNGRDAPPDAFFEIGHCSVCDEVLLVCDPWLSDLCLTLGITPSGDSDTLPRLRQPFAHSPVKPHAQMLAVLSDYMQMLASQRKGEG